MSSLLRSTKFVRYFTGAARTLILNSAKTAEVNLLVNPKALCTANNVLMRDYAKKAESLEPLLQKLDSEVKRFGRITKRDIDEIFDEIHARHNITSSQSLLVIRCCGELVPEELPEQRTLLVQKIWGVLTERGVPMDISHYNALLRVYLENEHPFSPAKFLEELEKKGLQPNRVTYQRLMWRYCQDGDVDGATKVLEKMRELNMPVSEPVLNALVMGHAFHGDTEGAKAVLDTMAGAGLQPSNRTYALLACGYAKQGDIDSIENVIKTATEKDAYMTDKDILDIIEYLAIGGHGNKAEKLFSHLQKGYGYNQDVCNLILKLLNKGHEETAKEVMKTMLKSSNQDDTLFKGAFFIKQLLKVNKSPDNIISSCRNLKEEGIIPNSFYIATEGALQQGQTELALKLFKELQKDGYEIRSHYFWPLLAQKGKENDEEGLLQILREMHNAGVPPNGETLRDYVIPYLIGKDSPQNIILKLEIANVPVILSARNLMVELLEIGDIQKAAELALRYRPRGQHSLVARPLIQALIKTNDIDSFIIILHVISTSPQSYQSDVETANDEVQNGNKINSKEIGRIVKTAVTNLRTPELCEKLLVALLSKGLRITSESAEAIEQFLGNNMTTNLSEILSKLDSPDLELIPLEGPRQITPRNSSQLEKLLTKVKSQNGNINRIQKQLLVAYMDEGKMDKVESYLEELESTKFELTPVTLGSLFEFYCENNNITRANEIKAKLNANYPEFSLNKFKLVQMAYALVRANKYDEAIQFLKDNKPSSDEESLGFRYKSKCWQLLNSFAESRDDAKVKEMTKVLIENNYTEATNIILGPSIKVHILKEDIEGALKEFEYCCNQYRSTPWKGELMKALILKEDATKLQWLADLSTQIHGEVNILHDLVLAFVECGRLKQARRILETPGLQTRQRRLQDACQRYVEEGKSEYLEGLLEATKELSHIDRTNIYHHLLVTYCKANETDKALGLWTLLQEEGEIPSDQFLMTLGDHLKRKGREVPFVIPQEEITTPKITLKKRKSSKNLQDIKQLPTILTKREVTEKIENLINVGNIGEAMDYTVQVIENGLMPKSNVLKYLLKNLANEGNVEKIQLLSKYLNEEMRRNVTYDDKLTLAIFNKGEGAAHIENLLQSVQAANTDKDLNQILKRFPRSNALASIMDNEELISKCRKIAEIAASKGILLPINLLWMEYIIKGKEQEANQIWNQYLIKASALVFRRLLQESYVRKEPYLIQNLIKYLHSNKNISMGSVANAYSRLIDYYLSDNKLEEAKTAFEEASKGNIKLEQFNKNCVQRLKAVLEKAGKEFNYAV